MQEVIFIFLIVILFFLAVGVYQTSRQVQKQKIRIKELESREQAMEQDVLDRKKLHRHIWESVNTIHLYASLSKEGTESQEEKEKQSEIIRISEEILRLMEKDNRG